MSTEAQIRRHELFEYMHSIAVEKLMSYKVDADVADQAACAMVDAIATDWGGLYVTIPKDTAFHVARRDVEIYNEFDGRNHAHLARKYHLTVRSIYDVIKRVRKRGDPNQPELF